MLVVGQALLLNALLRRKHLQVLLRAGVATSHCQFCTQPWAGSPLGLALGQTWGEEVGGLSCATGLLGAGQG